MCVTNTLLYASSSIELQLSDMTLVASDAPSRCLLTNTQTHTIQNGTHETRQDKHCTKSCHPDHEKHVPVEGYCYFLFLFLNMYDQWIEYLCSIILHDLTQSDFCYEHKQHASFWSLEAGLDFSQANSSCW